MRENRKDEHIENYLKSVYEGDNLLSNLYVEYNALPELSFDQINTETEIFGKKVSFPLIINAMTGGTDTTEEINENLARLAKEYNIAMAVGSQRVALEKDECIKSFTVVRDILGEDGIVLGNLSGNSNLEEVKAAAAMIDADAMQLHINPVHELIMQEGDRDFTGTLDNVAEIVNGFDGKIVIKEVGFGLSKGVIHRLYNKGVRIVDIAGHGGTNFVEIENNRRFDRDYDEFYSWGIPTGKILVDMKDKPEDLFMISSGGIKTGNDIAHSFILGADFVGISGEILSYLMFGGYDSVKDYIEALIDKTKIAMLLMGAKDLKELRNIPYRVTGRLKELTD